MEKSQEIMSGIGDINNKMLLFRKPIMARAMAGFSLSEISYIEYVGKHANANVTRLASALYMTRGAISKMTRKLQKKGIIESFQKPENKKEIYFTLTDEGRRIDAIHRRLHADFIEADKTVFAAFSEEELAVVARFVAKYNDHLDAELR
ncbi:MarR family transcriptional regulator [Lactococcus hodotermopsidis]|uniref:MarR family transcriptional regulator n=1 Tax=Pseudolactococcus hodotermopsidis TaxID=2709157 RepID=A0A6A0BDM1_9LACT|nr:MarR family transcriptional regulator [Lactococcus hodotermopsidis]GFH42906.1 MarR family transcriptional regulator [Lactococcus hodotermopsidis]